MKHSFLQRVLWLLIPLLTFFTTLAWGADVKTPTSGSTYRFKATLNSTDYYLVAPTSSAIGPVSTTQADGTIFTFTQESGNWYITFVSGGTTYYMYESGSNGQVSISTTKTKVTTVTTNGNYTKIGGTKWIQFNGAANPKRMGCYSSSQTGVILEEASSCTGLTMSTVTAVPGNGSISLSWSAVTNADSYTVTCKNKSTGVAAGTGTGSKTGTSCTISGLDNGTEYTWSVEPVGSGTYCSSNTPATGDATPNVYYTVTFMRNGSTYDTKSIASGSNLVLPDNPSSCDVGKEFVGWSATNIGSTPTNTKPTMVSTQTTVSAAVTYYAVFATKTADSYSLGNVHDLIEGQKVLIVNTNSTTAMSNSGSSGKLTATGVTIDNSKISSPASSLVWTVELDGAKYKFKNGYYVYAYKTNTNTSLYCDNDDSDYPDSWTITDAGSSYYYLYSDRSTSAKELQYYNSNFSTYTANTTDAFKMQFFVPTYTGYITTCCTPPGTALSITGSTTVAMDGTLSLGTSGGNGNTVTWSVATLSGGNGSINSSGVLTPSAVGTVTVTASQGANSYCAQEATLTVTINAATVHVSSVSVDPTTKAIVPGETFTITPTVSPGNATDKSVTWNSGTPAKATVSNAGLVTGVAAGSSTITCTTTDGSYTATCAVTVYGVTLQAKADDGNGGFEDIAVGGPGAPTRSGTTITAAANAGNYVFKEWSVTNATAASTTTSPTTISSPSGAVTVTAVYYKPINVTWKVGNDNASGGTATVGYNTKITTLPTAPDDDDLGSCATKFMGWSTSNLGSATGQSAPPDLFTSASDAGVVALTSDETYYAVFATGTGEISWEMGTIDQKTSGSGYATYNGEHTVTGSDGNSYTYTSVDVMNSSGNQFKAGSGKIYNTTSLGYITKIVLDGSNSYTNQIKVYESNSLIGTDPSGLTALTGTTTDLYGEDYEYTLSGKKYFLVAQEGLNASKVNVKVYFGTPATDYVTKCCTTLGAIDGTADATGTETTLTVKNWTAVSNVTNYTVKLYKKNAGEWELANNNSTTGGASGAQATRTEVTDRSTGVTWSGLTYGDTYKVTVQAIGNGTSYCDGAETAIDEINETALTNNEIPWKYSIYIDDATNANYAHNWIESLTSHAGSVNITLQANKDYYQYKLVLGGAIMWYGNNGKMVSGNSTNWTFTSGYPNCKLQTGIGGTFTFAINTATPTVSVTYPDDDQDAGYKIYWDNSILDWSSYYYRVGNTGSTVKEDFTLVTGTDKFYYITTPSKSDISAWHIANNYGWTGSNSIYKTKTGDGSAISASTAFQQYIVTGDLTIIPTTTSSKGTDDQNNNCDFYTINTPTSGMLVHTATITTPTNGSISLAYTSKSGSPSTSTVGDLPHRTIITATAVPATGYEINKLYVTPSGGEKTEITSGASGNHILAVDATFEAEFRAKTYTITLDNEGADVGHEGSANVVLTYNSNSHAAITNPQKTGYTFAGWYSGDDGAGELVINTSGVLQNSVTVSEAVWTDASGNWIKDGTVTLHAKWTINQHTLTWNWGTDASCSGVAGTDYTAGGSVNYGATINYPDEALLSKTGYHFTGWSTSATTMPDDNLTITASWAINTYTVTWYVNGEEYTTGSPTTSFNHGTTIAVADLPDNPSAPSNCSSKVFVGWSVSNVGSGDGHPNPGNLFTSSAGTRPTVTSDLSIYAVFADETTGSVTQWEKKTFGQLNDAGSGTYIIIDNGGYPYDNANGSSTHLGSTAFEFTNGVATSAPAGSQELYFEKLAANHFTVSKTYYDESQEKNVTKYMYATDSKSNSLAWAADIATLDGNYWVSSNSDFTYSKDFVKTENHQSVDTYAHLRANGGYLNTYRDNSYTAVHFVKKTTVESTVHENYVTTCTAPTKVATPQISPNTEAHTGNVSVTITCETDGAAIYYTIDGSTPNSSSTLYEGEFTVSCSGTLQAIGIKSPMTNSDVASQAYTVTVPRPIFSPLPAGDFHSNQNVTITLQDPGLTDGEIRYTTDGTNPTSSSTLYTGAITVTSGSTTIKAIGYKSCCTSSAIVEKTYRVRPGTDYSLVTDVNDLMEGDKVIIVASNTTTSDKAAISTEQNSNNRSYSNDFDINAGLTTATVYQRIGEEKTVDIFELVGEPGAWAFKGLNNKYLGMYNTDDNILREYATNSDAYGTRWTIDITSNIATITNNKYSSRYIELNGAIFAAYTSDQTAHTKLYSIPNPEPLMRIEGTLSAFAGCTDAVSAEQSFYVSGRSLSADIRVTAPTGYEVSLSSGSGYAAYIDVGRVGTKVSKTQVYVRLKAGSAGAVAATNVVVSVEANSLSQNVAIPASTIAAADTYIDRMHGAVTSYGCGEYTVPSLSDFDGEGTDCQENYAIFQGWVAESDINLDGTLKAGATVVAGGASKTASGTTYYSIWEALDE